MRLPTREELVSVYESGIGNLSKPTGEYWASRLVIGSGDYASMVNLQSGAGGTGILTEHHYCRCVSGSIKSTDPDNMQVTVMTYYNMLKADDEQIRVLNGKWCAVLQGEAIELNVADVENGYMEFKDPGTGGGGTAISAALFLMNNQTPVLAELRTTGSTGTCPETEYELKTYKRVDNKMVEAPDIVPRLTMAHFVSTNYDLKKCDAFVKLGHNVKIGYKLSKDKSVEAFLDISTLSCALSLAADNLLNQQDKNIKEFLDHVGESPMKLEWDKETGIFKLPGNR